MIQFMIYIENLFFHKSIRFIATVASVILLVVGLSSYKYSPEKIIKMNDEGNSSKDSKDTSHLTPKVTGVGGVFFRSKNPENTRKWYSENLGIEMTPWGSTFELRNLDHPEEIHQFQWSTFKEDTKYFDPSKKEFMINYTVQNIEGLVAKLKNNGVTVLDTIENSDFGKFVHVMDQDGNKIELWEPVKSIKPLQDK